MGITDKYIKDGKVGVLYSPGYGVGWSTWANDDQAEFLCMDKTLVEMALAGESEGRVEDYLASKDLPEAFMLVLGWRQIVVEWVEAGMLFRVDEYEGNESLGFKHNIDFMSA